MWISRLGRPRLKILMIVNQQARQRVTIWAKLINFDFQGETGMFLHNGSEEENVWNEEDPLKFLLFCPIVSQQKLQQPTVGITTNVPDLFEITVTTPGKEL